jgi:hypothetical protein
MRSSLSVVVAIVDGGAALERCLAGLARQEDATDFEVIVPWDDSVTGIDRFAERFPSVRFLPLGSLLTPEASRTLAGQHELYDRRRAAGLTAASGHIVALLEDRGVPRPDWAAATMRAHADWPHAVIGGAVENSCDRWLNWAVFYCDFGRYEPPFDAGPRRWISDVNVAYKRAALERTQSVWRHRYQEPEVHHAMLDAGETLYLTPAMTVTQVRDDLRLGSLVAERVAWGRLFAEQRVSGTAVHTRLAFALASPLLPLLLFARLIRIQVTRRVRHGAFVRASPIVLMLLISWSLGELTGYITSKS